MTAFSRVESGLHQWPILCSFVHHKTKKNLQVKWQKNCKWRIEIKVSKNKCLNDRGEDRDEGSGSLIIEPSAIVWFKLGFTPKQSHELTDM